MKRQNHGGITPVLESESCTTPLSGVVQIVHYNKKRIFPFALLVTAVLAGPPDAVQSGSEDRRTPPLLAETETITRPEFTLSAPKGWRNRELPDSSTMKLYLSGDGKGLPIADENGSPLQVGMTVEQFKAEETLDESIADLVKAAKQSPLF